MAETSDGRSFRTAIFIRQSSDEQRNVTPIFILNYLHSPPLSFLTEICNLLFVKQIPHNRAYIDHEKYVSAWFLVAPNTRIKRNRRNGERRRNWNEIITLKATGFRRRAGMDKKKKKRNYSSGIKENAVGLCPEKCTRPFLVYPAENFSTRQLSLHLCPTSGSWKREREKKNLLFHGKVSSKVSRVEKTRMNAIKNVKIEISRI